MLAMSVTWRLAWGGAVAQLVFMGFDKNFTTALVSLLVVLYAGYFGLYEKERGAD